MAIMLSIAIKNHGCREDAFAGFIGRRWEVVRSGVSCEVMYQA